MTTLVLDLLEEARTICRTLTPLLIELVGLLVGVRLLDEIVNSGLRAELEFRLVELPLSGGVNSFSKKSFEEALSFFFCELVRGAASTFITNPDMKTAPTTRMVDRFFIILDEATAPL